MSETNTDSVTSDLSEGAATPPPQPSSEMTPTVAVAPTPTPTTVAPVVTPVVAPKPTPQETYDAQLVAVLKERLEQYKKYLMVPIASHVTQKSAAQTLDAVVQSVLSRPIPDVFEVVWDFFVVNATGVCHEGWALQGVDALDKQRRFKLRFSTLCFAWR
ncbi:unnamed protein product [Sphagnum jensenii]|uniref:Uncharacterized protein n=1 Tax=Sphagnum jensenii TaxID=128206 RepID=A0ABP0VIB5_9BRYO